MENTNKLSIDELKIQTLLQAFLLSRDSLKSSAAETSFHVDEDFLTAFTEGNLSERESLAIVNHLVNCGFCRHKTAELVRLDLAFQPGDENVRPAVAAEPNKISDVLNGLLAKIFGNADGGAVFAHNEKEPAEKSDQEGDETEEKE
jgi:hypothetical protein